MPDVGASNNNREGYGDQSINLVIGDSDYGEIPAQTYYEAEYNLNFGNYKMQAPEKTDWSTINEKFKNFKSELETAFSSLWIGTDNAANVSKEAQEQGNVFKTETISQNNSKKDLENVVINLAEGAADTAFGEQFIEGIKETKTTITKVPALGLGAKFETATLRNGVQALKVGSKFIGPAAIGQTTWDVVEDFNKFQATDRYRASGATIAGATIVGLVGGELALQGRSTYVVISGGAVAGLVISKIVDSYKERLLENPEAQEAK